MKKEGPNQNTDFIQRFTNDTPDWARQAMWLKVTSTVSSSQRSRWGKDFSHSQTSWESDVQCCVMYALGGTAPGTCCRVAG